MHKAKISDRNRMHTTHLRFFKKVNLTDRLTRTHKKGKVNGTAAGCFTGKRKGQEREKKNKEMKSALLLRTRVCVVCGLSLFVPVGTASVSCWWWWERVESVVECCVCVCVVSRSSLHAQQPPHALHLRRTFSHESRQREEEGGRCRMHASIWGGCCSRWRTHDGPLIMRRCP